MKCENCGHINPDGSRFCEECGAKLTRQANKLKTRTHHVAEELDDIIFTPKRKDNSLIIFFIILSIIVVIFLIFVIKSNTNSSSNPDNSTTSAGNSNNVDVSCLTLDGGNMDGNSYYNPNPTYKATIHNACSKAFKDVIVRVNFYQADCTNTQCVPLDTEYINVVSYLGIGDSYSISQTVKTNLDTSKRFRWYAEVYTATPL